MRDDVEFSLEALLNEGSSPLHLSPAAIRRFEACERLLSPVITAPQLDGRWAPPDGYANRGIIELQLADQPYYRRLSVGRFDDEERAKAAGVALRHVGAYRNANVWPDESQGIRDAVVAVRELVRRVCSSALGSIEAELQLQRGRLTGTGPENTNMAIAHYLPVELGEAELGRIPYGDHIDLSSLSIIWSRSPEPCLWVQGRDRAYRPSPLSPNRAELLVGETLSQQLRGTVPPARHRVHPPAKNGRTAVIGFYQPNLSTSIGGTRTVWDLVTHRV